MLFSLYRAADYFISLAWLDHCPNAVIEARAAGAHVICTSAGGTEEVAGLDSTVIEEDEWDFKPCKLYQPPQLDFSRKRPGKFETNVDIRYVAEQYERVLKEACTPGVAML
jgi:glycosyltransferase involved in cell wall biosynthesis